MTIIQELYESSHKGRNRSILLVLALHADKRREVSMGMREMARKSGWEVSTVEQAIASLLKSETLLIVEAGSGRRAARYRICTLFTEQDESFDSSPLVTCEPHGKVTTRVPLCGVSFAEMQSAMPADAAYERYLSPEPVKTVLAPSDVPY